MVVVAQFGNNSLKLNNKSYLPSYLLNESIFCQKIWREENLTVLWSGFLCELHCKVDLMLSSILPFNSNISP